MQLSWISRRGNQTRANSDALAIADNDDQWLGLLVDGAEIGGNGQALAHHWATTIASLAQHSSQPLTPTGLVDWMCAEQLQLRHRFLRDIASYCCVLLDKPTGHLDVLFTGDCRAGLQQAGGRIEWLGRPHTLDRQQPYSQTTSDQPDPRSRLLTRSLNARRFVPPEIISAQREASSTLLLCTDGYWLDHLQRGTPQDQLPDDASLLMLAPGEPRLFQQSDTENFFIIS